jgi:hypothetical protein
MTRDQLPPTPVRWARLLVTTFAGACITLSTGCSAGPCAHIYEEDILILNEVRDALTNAPLQEVIVTEVRYEGTALATLVGDGLTSLGGDTYRCQLPCSFGTSFEGRYEVDLSVDGYEATTLVGDARYTEFQGGCPASSDGGTRLEGAITPIAN